MCFFYVCKYGLFVSYANVCPIALPPFFILRLFYVNIYVRGFLYLYVFCVVR